MQFYKKKWFIYTASLVIIILAIVYFANSILSTIAEKKIRTNLANNKNNAFSIEFDDIRLNIFTGSALVENITIETSDSIMEETGNQSLRKPILINIEKFKLSGFGIFGYLSREDINISSINIKNISVEITKTPEKKKNNEGQKFDLANTLGKKIKNLDVKSLKVINVDIKYFSSLDSKNKEFSINDIDLSLQNLAFNSKTMNQTIPFSLESFTIHTGKSGLFDAQYYSITSDGIKFNLADSSLVINNFALDPKFNQSEFNKKQKYNTDWFDIDAQNIRISNIKLSTLIANKKLVMDKVKIKKPNILIYRDKRLPDAPFKYKALVSGVIKKIPLDIKIDSIQISDARLAYEEQLKVSDKPGLVFFDPMYLDILNLTNIAEEIKLNPELEIAVKGKLMGQSFLNARLIFPLNRNDEYFTLKGNLNPISADAFNPFVKNGLNVNINDGKIHKTSFSITANNDASTGSLIMDYENLQVTVMKSKDQSKKSGFVSWVANEVIRKNNLESHHKYKVGTIGFERRKDRFIVNYIWNSLKSGIISIVAPIADKNKEKEKSSKNKKEK